ncbi:MAG: glycosyltransferase family 2 protein [Gammaproteobacteria bacterium]|nr:glycosyltransferase family 2 protein [Gammaproteobacteria bacterium]
MKSISYIIVTHNSQVHFPSVIDNLKLYTKLPYEIIVVDNDSKCTSYIKNIDKIIKNKENLMFTPATNQGLAAASPESDYLILINPDVRIGPNSIEKLINDTETLDAGIAGAILCYPDLKVQHGGGEGYGKKSTADILELTGNAHLNYSKQLHEITQQYPLNCQWITGAVFLITRKTLIKIGPLDEKYTHYKSDLEYCLRAHDNNIKIICSSAVCLHFHKKSTPRKQMIQRLLSRIRFKLEEKRFFKALGKLEKK